MRFADDFQVSWDEWKPDVKLDVVMNALVVPHGTYEVCSRTTNPRSSMTQITNTDLIYESNAKWILSIEWQMRGIDIHLDTNIGKRLSAVGSTLTMLTGEQFDTLVKLLFLFLYSLFYKLPFDYKLLHYE